MGIRLDANEQRAFLERGHTGILTTLRRDGWPVSLPVWYAVVRGAVYFSTPPTTRKLDRIRHDERCSFLVESGERWLDLAAVEFRARAVVVTDEAEADEVAAALAEKYDRYGPPLDRLPGVTRDYYSTRRTVRLDPVGPALSWDNQRIRLAPG